MSYPRMLFPNGEPGRYLIVQDAEEEARARADGYAAYGQKPDAPPDQEQAADAPKRRGRPPKVRE